MRRKTRNGEIGGKEKEGRKEGMIKGGEEDRDRTCARSTV